MNFVKADNCFKIITCDPLDDTIGPLVSTMAGVANVLSIENYSSEEFQQFFLSLQYICEIED